MANDNNQTCCDNVKVLLHNGVSDSQSYTNLYHAHPNMNPFIMVDTVFSSVESIQEDCNSYSLTKCCYKFGNLKMYTYLSNELAKNGIRETIPKYYKHEFLKSIERLKFIITGSNDKYISQLFTISRNIPSYIDLTFKAKHDYKITIYSCYMRYRQIPA